MSTSGTIAIPVKRLSDNGYAHKISAKDLIEAGACAQRCFNMKENFRIMECEPDNWKIIRVVVPPALPGDRTQEIDVIHLSRFANESAQVWMGYSWKANILAVMLE
jgi:hypothetical protein